MLLALLLLAAPDAGVACKSVAVDIGEGFKLFAIRADSQFERLGLKNRDTVHAFDGLPLTRPDETLAV